MWARFYIPVLALFYVASQVPIEQFAVIMGVFSLTILLFEVPSGVVADIIGKKKTLMIARFAYVIELFLVAFFNGFWIFFIAKIISGFAVSLSSGADDALLYDTLKKLKIEHKHKEIYGKFHMIMNVSMAVFFIAGSILFTINPKLPAIISIPFAFVGFILTFLLEEPFQSNKQLSIKSSMLHFKEGWTYFKNHKYVKYLVLYSFPVYLIIHALMSMSSAYLKEIQIPISVIGLIAFISSMIIAYASKKANQIEEYLGEAKTLRAIQVLAGVGVFFCALMIPFAGAALYMFIPFVSGFFVVIINHYMNAHIESSHRATMLSIKNMFDNLAFFLFFPIIGYLIKFKSMQFSFLSLGIFFVVWVFLLHLYARNKNFKEVCK